MPLQTCAGDRAMAEVAGVDQVEDWEFDSPAHLQYWPAHVHPTGPGSWDRPRLFSRLRGAIAGMCIDAANSSACSAMQFRKLSKAAFAVPVSFRRRSRGSVSAAGSSTHDVIGSPSASDPRST